MAKTSAPPSVIALGKIPHTPYTSRARRHMDAGIQAGPIPCVTLTNKRIHHKAPDRLLIERTPNAFPRIYRQPTIRNPFVKLTASAAGFETPAIFIIVPIKDGSMITKLCRAVPRAKIKEHDATAL